MPKPVSRALSLVGFSFVVSVVAPGLIAGCSANVDTPEETGRTSEALISCPVGQYRECSHEGPRGSLICWCMDMTCPGQEKLVCVGTSCSCHTAAQCTADTALNPPAVAGCHQGIKISNQVFPSELWMCPPGTPLPTTIYGAQDEMVMQFTPGTVAACDGTSTHCTYIATTDSCIPVPPTGWFYIDDTIGGPPGGGGGCHGPCEFIYGP